MRAGSAVILIAVGLVIMYLVVTGKLAAILDCVQGYAGAPAGGTGTAPASPSAMRP